MKSLARVLLSLAVFVLLVGVVMAESAGPDQPPPPVPTLGPDDILMALPYPDLSQVSLPPDLTLPAAQDLARSLMARAAAPFEAELHRLQAEGSAPDAQLQVEPYGVVLRGKRADVEAAAQRISALDILAGPGSAVPQCALDASEALPRELLARSVAQRNGPEAAPAQTNPSIALYVSPSYATYGWSNVSGRTDANVPVKVEIIRTGRTVATRETYSNSEGNYWVYPSYHSCPDSGYDWMLRNGDVVRVTASGRTVSTVAASVDPQADPTRNVVFGATQSNRRVQIMLYRYGLNGNLCGSELSALDATADERGRYSVSGVDFDRAAQADARSFDAAGNYSYSGASAYRAYCAATWGFCGLILPPNEQVQVTVTRAGQQTPSTYNGKTAPDGWFYVYLPWELRAGDRLTAISASHRIDFTAAGWTDNQLDPLTDELTARTSADRRVQVYFERDTGSSMAPTCGDQWACVTVTPNGDGSVRAKSPVDVLRGDYAYPYIYDADGNYQYTQRHPAAALYARLSWNGVEGFWKRLSAWLQVKLLDETNGTLAFVSSIRPNSYDGYFSVYGFTAPLRPGYKVEVSDGISTEVMTVQDISARLDDDTDRISGQAPGGYLRAYVWDYRSDQGYWMGLCRDKTHSGGQFSFTDASFQFAGQDSGYVRITGPDGHYTDRYVSAFTVNITKDGTGLWGYTETPNTQTTIQLKRGASYIYSSNPVSDRSGYFYASLPYDSPTMRFQEGDEVTVTTADGDSAAIKIPRLTTGINTSAKTIEGEAPPNGPLSVEARRHYSPYGYITGWTQSARAGANGRYAVSFAGRYWYRDCSEVDVTHPCAQAGVSYYAADDHRVALVGPSPSPATADGFEPDNERSQARPARGRQSHTFHSADDVDWVSFSVTQDQLSRGAQVRISMPYVGWYTTVVAQVWGFPGNPVSGELRWGEGWRNGYLVWTPLEAGVYYLRIWPGSSESAGTCDSRYDVSIQVVTDEVMLPILAN